MSDDWRANRLWVGMLLGALCLATAPLAPAETLRGYAQVQYQRLENGKSLDRSFDREWWVKSLQVDYAARLRQNLSLNAQAQVTDLSYTGRAEASRVPYGSLRLTHAYFGLYGAYRLQEQTGVLGTTSRQRQTIVSGYWARAKWPRLDLNWLRRSLDATARIPASEADTRSASVSHEIGNLSFRGAYSDQVQSPTIALARRVSQRSWSGGTSYLYGGPTTSLSAQYDFFDNRQGGAGPTDGTQTHSLDFTGGQRLSPHASLGMNYLFRRTLTRAIAPEALSDNDGALLLSYTPSSPFTFTAGGGIRTIRIVQGQATEEYVVASASARGRLLRGWTGGANSTYSINWTASEKPFAVNTYTANTQMRLWRGMDVNGSVQASVNDRATTAPGDSIARSTADNIVTQANWGASATPLHGLAGAYRYQLYRVGETLTGPATTSNSSGWSFNWAPTEAFRVDGDRSSSKGLGPSGRRTVTARANAQWNVSPTLQVSSSYTRSDQPRHDPALRYLAASKIVGVRVLSLFASNLQAIFGANWVDPGTSRSVRQFDASLTQRFGG